MSREAQWPIGTTATKSYSESIKSDSSIIDLDSSSIQSGRRPSVDTVSTYLSHDSHELRTSRVMFIIYFISMFNCINCNKLFLFLV
jgi:deltex-like protein